MSDSQPVNSDMPTTDLLNVMQQLAVQGAVRQLDYQFARFIASQQPDSNLSVPFIAGLASSELGKGHICVPMDRVDIAACLGLYGEQAQLLQEKLAGIDWKKELESSPVVGRNGEAKPLILDGAKLYLHRYWHYEVVLSQTLRDLMSPIVLEPAQATRLKTTLDHLFARSYQYLFSTIVHSEQSHQVMRQQWVCDHLDVVAPETLDWNAIDNVLVSAKKVTDLSSLDALVPQSACLNWQKVAAAVALTRRFAVISGGPGTGKTTTVAKLLAALVQQGSDLGGVPDIKLVAPTGKAAARLTESIGKAVDVLPIDPNIRDQIPTDSSTIHRLLGAIPGRAEFRHHKDNPLHLDILVVDEASMVDLSMMYKLVDAMPPNARLILLGDKDQLASVEAGAVLGDICDFSEQFMSPAQSQQIATLTGYDAVSRQHSTSAPPIVDCLCMLQKSYRFDARSGIGQLAKAINSGHPIRVEKVWEQGFGDIAHYDLDKDTYQQMLKMVTAGYAPYLQEANRKVSLDELPSAKAKQVLKLFSECRLLCAIREGDFGLVGLNHRIEQSLRKQNKLPTTDDVWYPGRPVMVTRNDHALGLYNGDIGICMLDESEEVPRLRVYFELPDGTVKGVLPSRVPEHETAYAMTIHKSQGSEFEHTIMVLPPSFSPILTRELIYTGITRAKKKLDLFGERNVMNRGVKVKTLRASGLAGRLDW
ncbi:exodeoxyribonuclease V subunit alpha [Vibrio sp. vnigr-6D03]|uniref:exodeoxyribonuclease V subunit alpha n=1 Tax=Vibrio sp. vnigr-6D03 TaxID=2058088 RepID=UPI000C31F3B8|nr:exodeoxyribonuclease V subunit alpha [Vibrio sp. vnigr-6D03]PKF78465.1 exodeoxyribonuclease V subunit alpha [Vibrio sp. vnigr-6D03]